MKNVFLELSNILEGIEKRHSADPYAGVIAGAYALWLGVTSKVIDIEDLPSFLKKTEENETIRMFLIDQLAKHWTEYRRHITAFTPEQLRELILTYKKIDYVRSISSAPEKLHDLVIALLDIKNSDYVADMGAGVGDFLKKVHFAHPNAELWGNEIATMETAVAMIRAKFLNNKLTVVQEDMFISQPDDHKFDKIYCFPPWGLRLSIMSSARTFLAAQPPTLPVLKGTGACEWIFALRMLASLKNNGKAVLLMANGGTFNLLDTPIRKYFVERGMIEAVIALPGRIFDFTGIMSSIVIFGNGNTHIQMVDATQLGNKGRRSVEFSDADIARIVNAVTNNDNEIGKSVSNEEILANDSVLNPGRYLKENIKLNNAVPFGSVIQSISRGASLTAAELDELSSTTPSEFQYLMLSNIKDGFIDDELPYLSNFDKRWERFCLKPNDLILSKIGYPFKVAIASESKHKIIANGNLFIIRLDENVADPYYIKAFLESETGITLLKSIAVGAAMPNLSTEAIRNMQIDLPPLQRQKEIAHRYKAKLTEIVLLKRKLAQAVDSLGQILVNTEA